MVHPKIIRGLVIASILSVLFFAAMLITMTLIDANYSSFTTNLPVVVIKFSESSPPYTDAVIAHILPASELYHL